MSIPPTPPAGSEDETRPQPLIGDTQPVRRQPTPYEAPWEHTTPLQPDQAETRAIPLPPPLPYSPDPYAARGFVQQQPPLPPPPANWPPAQQPPPPDDYNLPHEAVSHLQPVRVRRRRRFGWGGCLWLPLVLVLLVLAYFLAPVQTRVLVMGIDRPLDGTAAGRSDTIIIVGVNPLIPDVKMLSIPRDLWVNIPNVGENRINTAHYFAELEQPGSGARALQTVVNQELGVRVPYYVRVRFEGFPGVIDAMGGVDVTLPQDMGGLPAGTHHLDGQAAFAFVRDRQGADDFFRMAHGQLLIRAVLDKAVSLQTIERLPDILSAINQAFDTNIPLWQMPRLGLALLRTNSGTLDSRTLDRSMVTPTITAGGAQVLMPNHDAIRPLIRSMFGAFALPAGLSSGD